MDPAGIYIIIVLKCDRCRYLRNTGACGCLSENVIDTYTFLHGTPFLGFAGGNAVVEVSHTVDCGTTQEIIAAF